MIELNHDNNAACEKKTPVYAVIGNPVEHSLSPLIHQHFSQQVNINLTYEKLLGSNNGFEEQVKTFFDGGGLGLNITTPFKSRAYHLAACHTDFIKKSQVANTLWKNGNGEICADSTDGRGLIYSLQSHINLQNKKILLLGAGGAAIGVIDSLLAESISSLTVANRTFEKLVNIKELFPDVKTCSFGDLKNSFDIIINATTSSLKKTVPNMPSDIINGCVCLDMFYDLKNDTTFMEFSKKHHALKVIDGLEMLVGQAAASFERWHNKKVNISKTLNYLKGLK